MGNLCGKQESDNFSSPGRTTGTAPPTGPQSSSLPKNKQSKPVVGGPGRTLGGPSSESQASGAADDARRKAAEAAEARASSSNKPGGKLQSQLTAQKKQTRNDTLKEASRQETQTRNADDNAKVRIWE